MPGKTQISAIRAAQRLDSRGKPTVQVRVTTDDGTFQAIVPSGASKGNYEAIELRDGDNNAFQGNGVLTVVHNVEHVLGPAIIEEKYSIATDLEAIDRLMISIDGTYNKARLGANAILGVSMACTRRAAAANVSPALMKSGAGLADTSQANAALRIHSGTFQNAEGLCHASTVFQHSERRRALRKHDGFPGTHVSASGRFLFRRCSTHGCRGVC